MAEVRFATTADGVQARTAARRTAFVVDDGTSACLVRTRFVGPTEVHARAAAPLTQAQRDLLLDEIGYWSPQVACVVVDGRPCPMPAPRPVTWVALDELTVGQLTVDATKVAGHDWVRTSTDVVLACCEIDGDVMVVDGHSRAVAALRAGLSVVGVVLEPPEPLQHATRRWCREAGIETVAHLAARGVVDPLTHRRLWIDRCQAWLAAQG